MLLPLKVMPYTNAKLNGVFCVSQPNCRVLPPVQTRACFHCERACFHCERLNLKTDSFRQSLCASHMLAHISQG